MHCQRFIGIMSGTSLDGVDVALVSFEGPHPQLEAFTTSAYPASLVETLLALNQSHTATFAQWAHLQVDLAHCFSEAVNQVLVQAGLAPEAICAIGCHGQTLFHAPEIGVSAQLGHPAIVAKKTGIPTVADFRMDDLALGGQGAPLAPAFHRYLLTETPLPAAVINIGGIANVSLITSNEAWGFDTGPGNGLMDEFCRQTWQRAYDPEGQWAGQTEPDPDLVAHWLGDPYFQQPPPKTTGRDVFHTQWIEASLSDYPGSPPDAPTLLSSLNQLTAQSIAQALNQINDKTPLQTLYVAGGGSHNLTLIKRLKAALAFSAPITPLSHLDADSLEACMMAWLARQRIQKTPIALHQTTGANRDAVLGGVWHP